MDTFTENILARARERQKMLKGYGSEESSSSESLSNSSQSSQTRTRVSSELPGSPISMPKILNIQKENFNMEIKLTSTDNIRVEVEIAEGADPEIKNDVGLRDESKKRLKQLGRLYSGGDEADISSPIHRTESKFYEATEVNMPKSPRKGLNKLAHLAETINQWEDDIHPTSVKTTVKKSMKPPAPSPPVMSPQSSPLKSSHKSKAPAPPLPEVSKAEVEIASPNKQVQVVGTVQKKISWDKNVLDTLTSQGFTRTNSNSKLIYSYSSQNKKTDSSSDKDAPIPEDTTEKSIDNEKENIKNTPASPRHDQKPKSLSNSPVKLSTRAANIADKTALFESSPGRTTKDPALLSVSERKALFEKNKGEALIPKAPFGMAPPVKVETTMKAPVTKIMSDKTISISKQTEIVKPTLPKATESKTVENKAIVTTPKKTTLASSEPVSPVVPQSRGIAKMMAALLENKSTISQTQIENSIKSERQKEMDMLLNRFQRNTGATQLTNEVIQEDDEEEDDASDVVDADEETPMLNEKTPQVVNIGEKSRKSAEKRKSGNKTCKEDSPIVAAILDDVKRIKVSPPKAGKLYPNLSDIEATTETDTDYQTRTPTPEGHSSYEESDESDNGDADTSFGRDILEAIKNQTPQKRPIYDESTASDVSSMLEDDTSLEEVLGEENCSVGPTPPKQVCQKSQAQSSKPSNSFNYKNFSNNNTPKGPVELSTYTATPKKPVELPNYVVEGDSILPLTHTVSFYRKQQNQVQTPVRQVTRLPLTSESKEHVSEESELVEKKIKELQEEIHKQQNIIAQTSQALNLCSCTPEFSGSTEQVEADRVLLLATHRRQAALNELQRLKIEKTIQPQGHIGSQLSLEKGSLTISKIVLPLKHKYVKALAAAGGKGHHVVCLIKCCEQVVSTKLVSTAASNITNPDTELIVPGNVTLKNVYSDSTITFEVYCLQAQEEFLPHEIKYHISSKKAGSKLVTPKKSKDSKMVMPIKESPAGPQAVRTSSFAMMGYVVFPVQAMNKKVFTLNNTPPMSPLEGTIEMRISCELAVSVEHRGFLTMFDDVSGFGAWHRRWCVLKGHTLSYWKYPDDEKKKAPIDSIDLKNCITKSVGPVSREICARLHTFLLERERPAYPQDKDSLVTICKGDKTIIRHLLSADTKEERIEWCEKFNLALNALRMWDSS